MNQKKSIFSYVTDSVRFTHEKNCDNFHPLFVRTTQAIGAVDIENDLRGMTRLNTRCACGKYKRPDVLGKERSERHECQF